MSHLSFAEAAHDVSATPPPPPCISFISHCSHVDSVLPLIMSSMEGWEQNVHGHSTSCSSPCEACSAWIGDLPQYMYHHALNTGLKSGQIGTSFAWPHLLSKFQVHPCFQCHTILELIAWMMLQVSALHYSTRNQEGFQTLASACMLCLTTHYSCLSISGVCQEFWGYLEVSGVVWGFRS